MLVACWHLPLWLLPEFGATPSIIVADFLGNVAVTIWYSWLFNHSGGSALLTLIASMLTMQFRQEEIPVPQRLRYASVLLLQAIPVAAALFVLFPRPSGPLWGLPEDAYGGRTGLSDSMSPGEIASLAESEEVVMRVGFDEQPPK